MYHNAWMNACDKEKHFPILDAEQFLQTDFSGSSRINFVMVDCFSKGYLKTSLDNLLNRLKNDPTAVMCLSSTSKNAMQNIRRMFVELELNEVNNPAIIICDSNEVNMEESLIHYSVETGALLLDGFGDGICLGLHFMNKVVGTDYGLMNSIAFGILQAARTRISKTEYISCPSCGRTLFDLQETTARIRAVTNHLKGVKIAIMGCIVNGPGEMADADFGYVGSGPGKITLYKGKEIVKRNVNSEIAVDELICLLKENDAWVEP
jgi:(E)-4-hydroxy-3-methylbut-2-enyl-diphosphate synthase